MRTTKYGMAFHTIRYFQTQGRDLNRMTGWPYRSRTRGRYTIARSLPGRVNLSGSARDLAHRVISLAAVLSTADLKRIL